MKYIPFKAIFEFQYCKGGGVKRLICLNAEQYDMVERIVGQRAKHILEADAAISTHSPSTVEDAVQWRRGGIVSNLYLYDSTVTRTAITDCSLRFFKKAISVQVNSAGPTDEIFYQLHVLMHKSRALIVIALDAKWLPTQSFKEFHHEEI